MGKYMQNMSKYQGVIVLFVSKSETEGHFLRGNVPTMTLPDGNFSDIDASSCYRKLEGQVVNLPVNACPREELEACDSNFQLPSP